MKNFPVIKDIGKEPLYWGLSLTSLIVVLAELIISIFFARGFISITIFLLVIAGTYFILLNMQTKYGNNVVSKFLKRYLDEFKGTKITLSEIKKTLKDK